ncbi:aldehyde ferredoxin oxidoreductase family protein [Moorella sulfitireducens (nom. illeg.)]|uniref:aldehyde ferredoxin oxidoreductase family protein n=1 Tax=Neomoorella sulfitireducens TaxID=2972948 RepID=UPI0021AC58B6|nr:aldehyde ferredoxin oxidoreductase family protein [Moorella sulfitireducens]
MGEPGGYWRRLLRVNLTAGTCKSEEIPTRLLEEYLGGSALATRYLFDEVPAQQDPLASGNKLLFAVGPFQGSGLPGSAKWAIVGKSPLTHTFAVATAGAHWGVRFKGCGYELVIIEGSSEEPVYLWLDGEKAELRPAGHLWGRDAVETDELIRRELGGQGISIAAIGPAGERGVAIACIVADSHSFAGRCGLGAVMGAKKLKAVAVAGRKNPPLARPQEVASLRKGLVALLKNNTRGTMHAHGTSILVCPCEEIGDLPVKYWQGDVWPQGAARIGAPYYGEFLQASPWPCAACPIGCHRRITLPPGSRYEVAGAGPEYESLGMLGSCCLVDDLVYISKANDLCNRLGIDTISAGAYVAFTMECFEKGLLNEKDTDGLAVNWGSGEALVELVRQIGLREGFGSLFAEGIRHAAREIGHGAEKLPVEVKGLDLPAHDPRTYFSLALNYATGTRGACHLRGFPHCGEAGMLLPEIGLSKPPDRFEWAGQAELAIKFQDLATVLDSLVCCLFMQTSGMSLEQTTACLNAVTGWELTPAELMRIGERGFNLQRLINLGDGLGRQDDFLPARMFEPAHQGFRQGKVPQPFAEALDEYYTLRGWDRAGRPGVKKLEELGLQ